MSLLQFESDPPEPVDPEMDPPSPDDPSAPRELVAEEGRCQEASTLSKERYIPCNAPAVAIVDWALRGRTDPAIRMCAMCAGHNVRNRGGRIVSTHPPSPDPPAPDDDALAAAMREETAVFGELAPSPDAIAVIEGEIVAEPTMLIPTDRILARMEGITAADRALAVILGAKALAITAIDDDTTEIIVGKLLDQLVAHQEHIERKVNPFAELAFKLHRALTGFRGQATAELVAGLAHLKPMLARRLRAKQEAEQARQRAEQAAAQKAERDKILAEAVHAEQTGESAAVVQQLIQEAEHVAAPPVAERPITAVKGAGTRDNWKAEVVNKRAVILHVAARLQAKDDSLLNLLVVDATTATQLARAQKSTMNIPGMRAVNDVAFTKRRTS